MQEPAQDVVIETSNGSPVSVHQAGHHAPNATSWRGPDRLSPQPSLGLVTLLCTALRAITTSYQQSDSPILVDTRLCIGQGNFPSEVLTWSQTVKMQMTVHGF